MGVFFFWEEVLLAAQGVGDNIAVICCDVDAEQLPVGVVGFPSEELLGLAIGREVKLAVSDTLERVVWGVVIALEEDFDEVGVRDIVARNDFEVVVLVVVEDFGGFGKGEVGGFEGSRFVEFQVIAGDGIGDHFFQDLVVDGDGVALGTAVSDNEFR